jgi:hypothetical protein
VRVSETGPDEGYEAPSRYERSFPGMVGAMIVTLAAIAAFVAFRAINRDDLEVHREAIDYLPQVADIQQGAPFRIAYPPELPEDWRVTEIDFDDEVGLTWSVDLLTDDGDYVAIRQAETSIRPLIDEYVDEGAFGGDDLMLEGSLADTWESWQDAQGDHAVVADLGKTSLLVFGTADESELEEFAASLVTSRVP